MKVNLYAVFDRCSGVYDGPHPGRADAEMVRNFSQMCTKADTKIAQSPEDFTLFKVGTWNDGTGEVEDTVNEKLINGAEAVAMSKNGNDGELNA
jgi:hypothetical protein